MAEELPELEPLPLEPDDVGELPPLPVQEQPVSLVGASEDDEPAPKIRAFGAGAVALETGQTVEFKRPMNLTGAGATRCKIFHAKIAPHPIEHMELQINEWADAADIEIKFVTQVVGVMEGKRAEPNIFIMVWY